MSLLEDVRIAEAYERILEKEEVNEILKLKPEAAKEAAKKKLQQMSDEIKRAIDKFGEDSKTVLYMRAKKKRMQGQLAHAMGEEKKECPEGHEWDEKMQECLPSSTGIKEQRKMTQKEWDAHKKKGNAFEKKGGKYVNFSYKGKDIPVPVVIVEKKDCPDGHEWDEKMQECLPSSTGIKEDYLDEKTFSTENAKKLAKIFMKELNLNKIAAQKLAERVSREAKSVVLPESLWEEVIADKEIKNAFNQWKKKHKEGSVDDFIKALKVDTGASKKAEKAARAILQMDAFRGIRDKDLIIAYIARIIDREMK